MATAANRKNLERAAWAALTLLVLASLVKTMLVGLEIDEQYTITLGYRLVKGDALFATMWEPHQTSALTPAVLVALFLRLTGGTTGVLLFVRGVSLLAKAVLSAAFYYELKPALGRRMAYLAALVLLAYTPKWFLGPDYIAQQFHFTVAAFLLFYDYYTHNFRRPRQVVLGGVALSLSFLAFPQSVFAAAVFFIGMIAVGLRLGEGKTLCLPRGAWLFVAGCAVSAAAFLAYVLCGIGLSGLVAHAKLILNDPQYNFTAGERVALLVSQALDVAKSYFRPLVTALAFTGVWVMLQKRAGKKPTPQTSAMVATALWCAATVLFCTLRALAQGGPDERNFCPALVVGGLLFFGMARRRKNVSVQLLFWLGYLPGVVAYLFILRSTLLGLAATFMYLTWPGLCAVLALCAAREPAEQTEEDAPAWPGGLLLVAVLAFLVVCRVWLVLTTGWKPATMADTSLTKIAAGPAAGTYADEAMADRQMALYEALAPYEGKQVLLAVGDGGGLGYLCDEGTLTVGQASVISGTDSDPRFITYFEEYPAKTPAVIVYDNNDTRDLADYHAWLEKNLNITREYDVTHGTAELTVLEVG